MSRQLDNLRQQALAFAGELADASLARPTTREQWLEVLARLNKRGWLGGGLKDLSEAGAVLEGLARGGADAGIPMTLTVHFIMALWVLGNFCPEQSDQVLGSGGLCCMAASEPKVGSHPRKIQTRAVLDGERWKLTGTKVFTTGGPLASHLLVLAVCGESGEGRDLGLFLVPTSDPGVRVEEMPTHPGLEAALHGATTFENATAIARLGGTGTAKNGWSQIVRPFRQWEDSLLQSWVAGLAWYQTRAALPGLEKHGISELLRGRLIACTEALATLARDAAASLLDEQAGVSRESLIARRYSFFEMLRAMEALVSEVRGALPDAPPSELAALQGLFNQLRFAARSRETLLAQAARLPG
ncbi:MAG: acyl-CoA dehydrogenase family protein [Chrysiogenetes bacterium]|nr:acyl-CoA dehydrogenase family protein [Chrysiogenetes bacterium]